MLGEDIVYYSKDDSKVLKGIALCLMLCHHLFAFPEKTAYEFFSFVSFGGMPLSVYIGQFGRICMPMFLFLSGYGTYLSARKTEVTETFVLKRIFALYRQVWTVFVISLPFTLILRPSVTVHTVRDIIYNFLGLNCTFNEEWWFIVPFAVLMLLFPTVKRFLDRKNASPFIDLLLLLLYSVFYNYILPPLSSYFVFSTFVVSEFWHKMKETLSIFPAFFLGCYFAKYALLDKLKSRCAGKPLYCVLSVLGMTALFYLHLYNFLYYDFINAALFICCIIILLPVKFLALPCKLLKIIADQSTFIWLTHTFFCYYWCQKLIYAPKYSVLIFLWLLLISFAAAKLLTHVSGKAEKLLKRAAAK